MTLTSCFGNYTFKRDAVCAQCTMRQHCALATKKAGFIVMAQIRNFQNTDKKT